MAQVSKKATGVPVSKIEEFEKWLEQKGAIILDCTNEWEELRFRLNGQVGIVYVNKKDRSSFVGEAAIQWELYKQSESF